VIANLAYALLALAWALLMSTLLMGSDIQTPEFWGFALFAFSFAAAFVGATWIALRWGHQDDEPSSW
jgi:hypothetical protein